MYYVRASCTIRNTLSLKGDCTPTSKGHFAFDFCFTVIFANPHDVKKIICHYCVLKEIKIIPLNLMPNRTWKKMAANRKQSFIREH